MVPLVPKPLTSGNRAKGLFDNATSDICPRAMSSNVLPENGQFDDAAHLKKGAVLQILVFILPKVPDQMSVHHGDKSPHHPLGT